MPNQGDQNPNGSMSWWDGDSTYATRGQKNKTGDGWFNGTSYDDYDPAVGPVLKATDNGGPTSSGIVNPWGTNPSTGTQSIGQKADYKLQSSAPPTNNHLNTGNSLLDNLSMNGKLPDYTIQGGAATFGGEGAIHNADGSVSYPGSSPITDPYVDAGQRGSYAAGAAQRVADANNSPQNWPAVDPSKPFISDPNAPKSQVDSHGNYVDNSTYIKELGLDVLNKIGMNGVNVGFGSGAPNSANAISFPSNAPNADPVTQTLAKIPGFAPPATDNGNGMPSATTGSPPATGGGNSDLSMPSDSQRNPITSAIIAPKPTLTPSSYPAVKGADDLPTNLSTGSGVSVPYGYQPDGNGGFIPATDGSGGATGIVDPSLFNTPGSTGYVPPSTSVGNNGGVFSDPSKGGTVDPSTGATRTNATNNTGGTTIGTVPADMPAPTAVAALQSPATTPNPYINMYAGLTNPYDAAYQAKLAGQGIGGAEDQYALQDDRLRADAASRGLSNAGMSGIEAQGRQQLAQADAKARVAALNDAQAQTTDKGAAWDLARANGFQSAQSSVAQLPGQVTAQNIDNETHSANLQLIQNNWQSINQKVSQGIALSNQEMAQQSSIIAYAQQHPLEAGMADILKNFAGGLGLAAGVATKSLIGA